MSTSLLRRGRIPAIVTICGISFYTENAITTELQISPFTVKADAFGDVDSRYGGRAAKIAFTPQCPWDAAHLSVLFPWQQFVAGDFNTPRRFIASVNTGTSVITTQIAHNQITGRGVVIDSTGALPTGLTANTTYFLNVASATTVKLYDTAAHAIAGGGTGLVAITGAGSGSIYMIQNDPLSINYLDGTMITFLNVGITKMPSLNLSAAKTPFGDVEFEAYTTYGANWSTADSLFTIGAQAFSDASFNESQLWSLPYTAAFGDAAPFDDLDPRDGVQIDFTMEMKEVMSDRDGLVCRSISNVSAMAKIIPQNLLVSDLLGDIAIQGTGAARGASLPSAELDVYSDTNNPYIALYGATLQNAPFQATSQDDPIKELQFKTKRTFSAGVAQPVFFVGEAAP